MISLPYLTSGTDVIVLETGSSETFGESVMNGDEPSADGCIRITKTKSSVCYVEPVPLGHVRNSLKTV